MLEEKVTRVNFWATVFGRLIPWCRFVRVWPGFYSTHIEPRNYLCAPMRPILTPLNGNSQPSQLTLTCRRGSVGSGVMSLVAAYVAGRRRRRTVLLPSVFLVVALCIHRELRLIRFYHPISFPLHQPTLFAND